MTELTTTPVQHSANQVRRSRQDAALTTLYSVSNRFIFGHHPRSNRVRRMLYSVVFHVGHHPEADKAKGPKT